MSAVHEDHISHRTIGFASPQSIDDVLLSVIESITSAGGLGRALDRLANLALSATRADRSAILIPDSNQEFLYPKSAATSEVESSELWNAFRNLEPIDIASEPERLKAWKSLQTMNRPIVIDDPGSSSLVPDSWREICAQASLAIAPLRAGGRIYGLLVLEYLSDSHGFAADEERRIMAIAGAAGLALNSAQLLDDLKRAVGIERRLSECTAALNTGLSLNEIIELVADRFVWLLPGASCSINLLTADGEAFKPVALRGVFSDSSEVRLQDLPAKEIATLRGIWGRDPHMPVVINRASTIEGLQERISPDIDVVMLLPLSQGRKVVGFVVIGRQGGKFSDDEVRVASAYADHAAMALARHNLNETLRARLQVIECLQRLSDVVSATSDLKAALAELNRGVGTDSGIECTRVTFDDKVLCSLLGAVKVNDHEKSLLVNWRKQPNPLPTYRNNSLAVPISMQHRISGILWLRAREPGGELTSANSEMALAIAGAIGEVAHKAKLRKTAGRRAQELAVAAERERIARDLHDTVGQTLYGIALRLQEVIPYIEDPDIADSIAEVRSVAAQGLSDVRSAVYALSFLHVRARGLLPSVKMLAKNFERVTGLFVGIKVNGELRLTEDAEGALYRVVHEALVNVDRHARASAVVVTLSAAGDEVKLTVRDDGVGLDQRQVRDWRSAAHFGIRSMSRAVAEIGGRFQVTNSYPRGLLIRAAVPARSPAHVAPVVSL